MPPCADGYAVTAAGPPENVRDHVMAASKSLGSGDWTNAYAHLAALPVWALVPGREQVRRRSMPSATETSASFSATRGLGPVWYILDSQSLL